MKRFAAIALVLAIFATPAIALADFATVNSEGISVDDLRTEAGND